MALKTIKEDVATAVAASSGVVVPSTAQLAPYPIPALGSVISKKKKKDERIQKPDSKHI